MALDHTIKRRLGVFRDNFLNLFQLFEVLLSHFLNNCQNSNFILFFLIKLTNQMLKIQDVFFGLFFFLIGICDFFPDIPNHFD